MSVAQPLVWQYSRCPDVVRRIRRRAEAPWPCIEWVLERGCISGTFLVARGAGNVASGYVLRSTTFFTYVGAMIEPCPRERGLMLRPADVGYCPNGSAIVDISSWDVRFWLV